MINKRITFLVFLGWLVVMGMWLSACPYLHTQGTRTTDITTVDEQGNVVERTTEKRGW